MPAIQPDQLKKQSALLIQDASDPHAFVRQLHQLFEFYADRAIRPGQATKNRPLTASYRVRPPVLRQILQELEASIESQPESSLVLCDALWDENFLEFKLLASMILGKIPATQSTCILQRVEKWTQPELETQLITALFDYGLNRLKQENPQSVMRLIEKFLKSSKLFQQQAGLRAIKPILSNPGFNNLPAFFQMLQAYVLKIHPTLRPDLLEVIAILAKQSPKETAYFLRESINLPNNPDTAWIIRHSLNFFPSEQQSSLREYLRQSL